MFFKSLCGRVYSDKFNMLYVLKCKNFVLYNIVRIDKGIKRIEIKVEISLFIINEVGVVYFDKMFKRF